MRWSEPKKLKKVWFQLAMPPCWQHSRHCDAEMRIDNQSCHLQTYQPDVCNDAVDEARLPTIQFYNFVIFVEAIDYWYSWYSGLTAMGQIHIQ